MDGGLDPSELQGAVPEGIKESLSLESLHRFCGLYMAVLLVLEDKPGKEQAEKDFSAGSEKTKTIRVGGMCSRLPAPSCCVF